MRNKASHLKAYSLLLITAMLSIACSNNQHSSKMAENEYYVCSMDPQVMEKEPGNCPICKMPLSKAYIDKNAKDIKLSNEQIKLANITTILLDSATIKGKKLLTGFFTIPTGNIYQVSARIAGRIEKLHFKVNGEPIKEGNVLYELYSKDLYEAQKEYLLALDKNNLLKYDFSGIEQLVNAAKNKLLIWGMTPTQIAQLAKSGKALVTVPVYSPENGIISFITISEGDYVQEGTAVYEITDLSTLWVEARLYNQEASAIELGDTVTIIPASLSDEHITGTVAFVNPELQEGSLYSLLRINIDNKSTKFRAGMQAYVQVASAITQGIALPTDALVSYAHNTIAWVQTAKNTFEPRLVETGITTDGLTEIIKGLNEGDKIVITGAYLLNSEFTFKRGANPVKIFAIQQTNSLKK